MKERDGSDERVDGRENHGRAPFGGVDMVDGRETVGNSLGRAPLDTMDGWETMGNDLGRGAGKRGK